MAPSDRIAPRVLTALITAAGSLAALGLVGALITTDPAEHTAPAPGSWWILSLILVFQAAGQLLPLPRGPQLVATAAAPVLVALIAPGPLFSITAIPIIVCAFLTGMRLPHARLSPAVIGAAALVAIGQFINTSSTGRTDGIGIGFEAVLQAIIVIGLPLLPAMAIASQRNARSSQQQALEAISRQRDAQIGEAIAVERAAMARELHDIAAHHLSGISIMAAAVEHQVLTDPDAARSGAAAVRQQSKETLEDLRRLVGLLRGAEHRDDAVKTLATVPALVGAAGSHVRLEIRGNGNGGALGEGTGPLAQLAAYRMVQESLTNATRYAPGASCTVLIDDRDPMGMRVNVRNAPPPVKSPPEIGRGSGFGILGMRERATLIGAQFSAGPTDDLGWETRMVIPRENRLTTGKEPA